MNILLFGPPGAGKGTQSALLVDRLGMRHMSTGDLFRAAIAKESALGLEAKKYMNEGRLVPDAIVIGMVKEELARLGKVEFILDGFPRTVAQAEALEELLEETGQSIDKAVFLEVPHERLMGRLTGRRVCSGCGANYHLEAKPPRVKDVCDDCGGTLIQREDDKEAVIRTRLTAYEQSTKPLKDFYASKGRLFVVEGLGDTEAVYQRISKVLRA